ncbi:MAG: radical SAM protein [Candidatus Methanomethylicia archaeon]|nr:radical SAM protein [Candidatus Methanomethylicia archaeon]MCX8169113.1 radical SAM protein [Candidatus Methanomethylicia archaeon]MDW7988845.1 radical SAM protein [Nitrososphaerota archaeon]
MQLNHTETFGIKREVIKIPSHIEMPLIGCIAFGIIDRGTNTIQIRPSTLCPLSCIFCSTDAGPKSMKRLCEFIVELDYLLPWVKKVVEFKGGKGIEAHIDTIGDPLTYPFLVDLVHKLNDIKGINIISMQTHGFLLSEKLVDDLAESGLSRINLSIDALDSEMTKYLTSTESYDINRILAIAEYITNSCIDLLIAPVWVPPINDLEIPKIIEYAKRIHAGKKWPPLGIQKFEFHKYGRKPKNAKFISWKKFYEQLKYWEEKFDVKLILHPEDFGIFKTPKIPHVFKKYEKIKAKIVGFGLFRGQKLAVAKNRIITVINSEEVPLESKLYIKILRVKDNIFIAEPTL